MRRRRPDVRNVGYPALLDAFDPGDWGADPACPASLGYGRIRWEAARRAYRDGDDWRSFLGPPAWAGTAPIP